LGERGLELVPAMPGQALVQRRLYQRMPERVPPCALFQQADPQRAIQHVEERRI
jgi:hypothetical protein